MTDILMNKLPSFVSKLFGKDYVKYLICGGLNTALTFLVFSGLILLGMHYFFANSIAWIFGIIVSFFLNSYFVFKKSYQHQRFLKFVTSNIFSYFLSMLILFVLIDIFLVHPILSSAIAIPFVVIFNYCMFKFLIFNK